MNDMPRKVVIQRTKPMGEVKAVAEARDAGAKAHMPPTEKVWRRGSRVASFRPLARGYVFLDRHIPTGQYVKGIVGRAQSGELGTLYARARQIATDERRAKLKQKQPPTFEAGTTVQIIGGPFDKFVGKVTSCRKAKIMVAIAMLGSEREVPVSAWKVRLV